jgi:uncharacterized metal-binding protein
MKSSSDFMEPQCGSCSIQEGDQRLCVKKRGKYPPGCPTANHGSLTSSVLKYYKDDPKLLHFARVASKVEQAGYRACTGGGLEPAYPRIVEIVHFSKRMGYEKLGLIFCFGLRSEAAVVTEILEINGFSVVSACCKAGNVPKSKIGLTVDDQFSPTGPEAMCNPILQAELMNKAQVDFNIMLGLCVGHDSLALKHVTAPITILAVKDRLMVHNPLACIYAFNSYTSYLHKPIMEFQEDTDT